MSKNPPIPKRFDPAILEAMTEPIFVRVERRMGGAVTPIDLPSEEGMPNGGFSKDRIRGTGSSPSLETWLVTEWTGGGIYAFTISDSSPDVKRMEWVATFDPRTYPPRQPPSMAGLSAFGTLAPPMPMASIPPPAPAPFVQPSAPQVPMSSSPWPSGFQFAQPAQPQPQYAAPAPAPAPFYPPVFVQQPQQQAPFTPFDRTAAMEKEKYEREKTELQQKLADAQKRETEERHAREMDNIRRENDRKLDELKASIAPKSDPAVDARFAKLESVLDKIVDKLTATPASTGPSPEMLAMQKAIDDANRRNEELQRDMQRREEKAESERRAENERRDRERSEQNLREEMRRQEAGFKEMIGSLTAMIAELKSKPTGPDPMIQFMENSSRQQLETVRDLMRTQQNALDNLRTMMMTPRDVLALAKEGQGGFDEMRRQITGTYGDVMNAYRQVLETSIQMQPQGESPMLGVVKDGMTQAKEFADRYFGNKSKEQIEAMRAQRAVYEAQARAAGQAAAAVGGVPPVAQGGAPVNEDLAQQAAQEAAGLGGAVVTPPPVYVPEKNAHTPGGQLPPSNVIPITQAQAAPAPAVNVPPAQRTDAQWFGPALPNVHELRDAVAVFLDAIQKGEAGLDPKTKRPKGASPDQAANAILQAAGVIAQQNIPVPAFTELFLQEQIVDAIGLILPNPIPQGYRDDVVKNIMTQLAEQEADDDEDDDDEDEDGKEDAS